jgi:dihydrofolate reductase
VTRQAGWRADGAEVAHSIEQACALCRPDSTAWVMGGAEIYALALPLASEALVTEIDADYEGDAFAPQFGPGWREVSRSAELAGNGLAFSFVTYRHFSGD